jgi:hypothetical protein
VPCAQVTNAVNLREGGQPLAQLHPRMPRTNSNQDSGSVTLCTCIIIILVRSGSLNSGASFAILFPWICWGGVHPEVHRGLTGGKDYSSGYRPLTGRGAGYAVRLAWGLAQRHEAVRIALEIGSDCKPQTVF